MFQCLAKPSKTGAVGQQKPTQWGRGREDKDLGSLLLTSQTATPLFKVFLPSPREGEPFRRPAPEGQSYFILMAVLLAFGLLLGKVTGNSLNLKE